jgi:IS4 transposase
VTRRKTIDFRAHLTSIFPDSLIETLARETGAFQRVRKIGIVAFFWTLVLGFGTGESRTLSGLRRSYELMTGTRLVASAFYDRFSTQLVRFLRRVVEHAIAEVQEPTCKLRGVLAGFRDLVVADATVIRLHDFLQGAFPACRTNHTKAAVKLHAIMSVNAAGPRRIAVTSERVHDITKLRVGVWVKDRVLVFDLAYFKFQLFSCIRRNGGYFISRLKDSANPTIVAVHRGSNKRLLGERIHDVAPFLKRRVIDVEVEATFPGRRYAGHRRRRTERFRVVGVRNPETREYHLYITNIGTEQLSAHDIARVYSARWLIELFFRELKRTYRADEMPSRKRPVVEALLYASILTFIASRCILLEVRRRLRATDRDVPDERWAALFADVAADLLVVLTQRTQLARLLAQRATALLLAEAHDPNRRRRRLLRQRAHEAVE